MVWYDCCVGITSGAYDCISPKVKNQPKNEKTMKSWSGNKRRNRKAVTRVKKKNSRNVVPIWLTTATAAHHTNTHTQNFIAFSVRFARINVLAKIAQRVQVWMWCGVAAKCIYATQNPNGQSTANENSFVRVRFMEATQPHRKSNKRICYYFYYYYFMNLDEMADAEPAEDTHDTHRHTQTRRILWQ